MPAFVLHSLSTTEPGAAEVVGLSAGVVLSTVLMVLIAEGVGRVAPVNVLKLAVAPAVGLAIVPVVGLTDPTIARTSVMECATPAAITPLIFAIEFDLPVEDDLAQPEYLATAILTTTLASVPTLTVLPALMDAGLLV